MSDNIAIIIGSLTEKAGSERVVVDSANHLSVDNNVYIFVCGSKISSYEVSERVKVISICSEIPKKKINQFFWYFKFILYLNLYCRILSIDVAICHWTKLSICLPFIYGRIKVWAHEHQNDDLLPKWLKLLKSKLYHKLDLVSVLNSSEEIISRGKYNEQTFIIPGYVSAEFCNQDLGLQKKCNEMLFVGRLVDEKQPMLMLEMLMQSGLNESLWRVKIIGDGPLKSDINNYINDFENGMVELLKPRELLEFYKKSKYLLVTSKTEGFGMVIIEAMSQGCVPISFDCDSGPRNIITDGVDGYLIKSKDDFIEKLKCILKQKNGKFEVMSKAAIEKSKKYSMSNSMFLWEKALAELRK
ncbi:glycosyltransferase [Aeromonas hydrophila]